ncbi:hypothetical protein KGQ71_04280 [Patescibacteria group bacterium]|nr:hypothetical protein [Patescibacteria group bacterium]
MKPIPHIDDAGHISFSSADPIKLRRGCSYKGQIDIPYAELVQLLGEPTLAGDGYKTDAEWLVVTPEGPVWLYNYKDGTNYLGEDGTPTDRLRCWHVGARNQEAAKIILKVFELFEFFE